MNRAITRPYCSKSTSALLLLEGADDQYLTGLEPAISDSRSDAHLRPLNPYIPLPSVPFAFTFARPRDAKTCRRDNCALTQLLRPASPRLHKHLLPPSGGLSSAGLHISLRFPPPRHFLAPLARTTLERDMRDGVSILARRARLPGSA
jgi:hypothetical protein